MVDKRVKVYRALTADTGIYQPGFDKNTATDCRNLIKNVR